MNHQIEQTHTFLKSYLYNAQASINDIDYRYEHSLRVANIGKRISKIEGANELVVVLGSLLHDVGKFDTNDNSEHGRVSAKVARTFLETINLTKTEIDDICNIIGAHADIKYEYDDKDIKEAKILRDADYIDRFGSSKTRLKISWEIKQKALTIEERVVETKNSIKILQKLCNGNFLETKVGNQWFREKLKVQIDFHESYLYELQLTMESLY